MGVKEFIIYFCIFFLELGILFILMLYINKKQNQKIITELKSRLKGNNHCKRYRKYGDRYLLEYYRIEKLEEEIKIKQKEIEKQKEIFEEKYKEVD